MTITWDEAKRRRTLKERGLDFADARLVFAGRSMTLPENGVIMPSRDSLRPDGCTGVSW
jgi:uncharacterized DUF497 family protein